MTCNFRLWRLYDLFLFHRIDELVTDAGELAERECSVRIQHGALRSQAEIFAEHVIPGVSIDWDRLVACLPVK